MEPIRVPRVMDSSALTTPTASDTRPPKNRRARISRPRSSQPNTCFQLEPPKGLARKSIRFTRSGS